MKEDGLSEEECKKTVARRIELGSVDLSLDPLLKSACAMDLTKVNASIRTYNIAKKLHQP